MEEHEVSSHYEHRDFSDRTVKQSGIFRKNLSIKNKLIIIAAAAVLFIIGAWLHSQLAEQEICLSMKGTIPSFMNVYYQTPQLQTYTESQTALSKLSGTDLAFTIPRQALLFKTRIDFGSTPGISFCLKSICFHKKYYFMSYLSAEQIQKYYQKNTADLQMELKNSELHAKVVNRDPYLCPIPDLSSAISFSLDFKRILYTVFLGIAILLILTALLFLDFPWKLLNMLNEFLDSERNVYLLLTILLVISVVCGLSGSSIGRLRTDSRELIEMNEIKLFGNYNHIRSDEWLLRTPFAIGSRQEGCPVTSSNFSFSGRNNLLRFYTGAPVWHLSSIAHPQTWGLMILPLRQGLSWYWFFPIFSGIAGIFALLNLLFTNQVRNNFFLSLALALSPVMAFWSFWPLLICGYMSAAAAFFLLFLKSLPEKGELLTAKSFRWILLWSLLTGWSVAASALILMPPRMIPCAASIGIVIAAHIIDEKLYRKISIFTLMMLLPCVIICLLIIGCWYFDAKDAIVAVANTVYPGKRISFGGGYDLWYVFGSGWWNFYSGRYENGDVINLCERASYFSMILPFFILFISDLKNGIRDWKLLGLAVFVLFAITYQTAGLPNFLAEITLWDRTHNERVNCAIAFSQILIIADLLSKKKPGMTIIQSIFIALLASLFSVWVFFSGPMRFLQNVYIKTATPEQITMLTYAGGIAAAAFIAYYFFSRNMRVFIIIFLLLNAAASFPFNPLIIAPSKINHIFQREIASVQPLLKPNNGRIMAILPDFNHIYAMTGLYAAGEKVAGIYFFYPDPSIYKIWFSSLPNAQDFNRKGHVIFRMADIKEDFTVELADAQMMYINLNRNYDFCKIPVDFVLFAPDAIRPSPINSSLELISSKKGFDLYRVRHTLHPQKKGHKN